MGVALDINRHVGVPQIDAPAFAYALAARKPAYMNHAYVNAAKILVGADARALLRNSFLIILKTIMKAGYLNKSGPTKLRFSAELNFGPLQKAQQESSSPMRKPCYPRFQENSGEKILTEALW